MKVEMSINSTIEFSENKEKEQPLNYLSVNGMSCKSGYIKDKDFIIPIEELENIGATLKKGVDGYGAYILKDHGYTAPFLGKSVDKLVGRIDNTEIKGMELMYSGKVYDKELSEKLKNKLVTSSSVGLQVNELYCSICGKEYGSPDCNHLLGKEYSEEPIHDMAKPYIEEMGGKNIAAIVGRKIEGKEQSIVLFPAIPGASVGLSFSEESESYINDIESKKKDLSSLSEKTVENTLLEDKNKDKLTEKVEGFNKENKELNSEQAMSIDLETLQKELKTAKDQFDELKAKHTTIENELATAKELLNAYKADEEKRKTEAKASMITKLVSLRKERELPEKDYSKLSLEVLTNELELLESIKPKAQASNLEDNEPSNDLKENIREVIFHSRKDDKKVTGLRKW